MKNPFFNEYRELLCKRYNELAVMPFNYSLSLCRNRLYKGGVNYIITLKKVYNDGTEEEEFKEVFPGKERAKALKRFSSLKASRPGIETVVDIAPKAWERRS